MSRAATLLVLLAAGPMSCRPKPPTTLCAAAELPGHVSRCFSRELPVETMELSDAAQNFFGTYGRGVPFPRGPYDMNLYPTEGLAPLWSAAELTGVAKHLELAEEHVEYAIQHTPGAVFTWPDGSAPPRVGSNTQARFALAYWLAYRATGNERYLRAAEAAHEVVASMPLVEATSSATGRTFSLPAYVYRLRDGALTVESGRTLDPNQDATLALLAAVLHASPGSVRYNDPGAAVARDAYLGALREMIEPDRCVPAADQPDHLGRCDSLYGWWTLFQAAVLDRLVPSAGLRPALERQYALYRGYTLQRLSVRSFPVVETTRLTRLDEALFALGVSIFLERWSDADALHGIALELIRDRAGQSPSEPFRFVGLDTSTIDLLARFATSSPLH